MKVTNANAQPLARSLDILGDRWTLLVVEALLDGPLRFGDLQQRVEGIAPNILAQRLRDLESQGLVIATPYSQRPVRMSYALSAAGLQLHAVIQALTEWSVQRHGGDAVAHDACGTALELRAWCPTCERVIEPDDLGLHHL